LCGVDDALQIPDLSSRSALEVFRPTKSKEVKVFDRGNVQTSVSLIVQKLHSTLADARIWQFRHPILKVPTPSLSGSVPQIPKVGVLAIQNPAPAPNSQYWNFIKGGFESINCKANGATTIANYSFVGGEPSLRMLSPDPI